MWRHANATFLSGILVASAVTVGLGADDHPAAAAPCAPPPTVSAPGVDVADAGFAPIAPARIADTRNGIGAPAAPLDAGCVLAVSLAPAGVPSDAIAVAMTVTSDRAADVGYVTAYPCGSPRPTTSNLNPQSLAPSPNLVVVPVDATASVCLFTERLTDLIVDVTGWFVPDGAFFHEITPVRAIDTRNGAQPAAGSTLRVPIAGAQAPAQAQAVAVTVTVTQAAASGYVTAYPCGQPRPPTSTNNVLAGQDRAASALLGLGDGDLCVYTDIPAHILVDVTGWFGEDLSGAAGIPFDRTAAIRVADTRIGPGAVGRFASGEVRRYGILDHVPLGTTAAQLEITTTSPTEAGYLTVFPCSDTMPTASSVNYTPGPLSETSLVTVGLGADGDVCVYASAPTDVVIDLFGSFGTPGLVRSFTASPALEQTPQLGQIDHTIRCAVGGGAVVVDVAAVPGARVSVDGGAAAPRVHWSGTRAEDGLVSVFVTGPGGAQEQHWIRCLPHDFPQLIVKGRSPTPGWYAASFLPGSFPQTVGNFAFILDEYGIPVWYKRLASPSVGVWTNGGGEIAWRPWTGGGFPTEGPPYGGIELHALDGSLIDTIDIPGGNVGWHELLTLPDGRHVVTRYREEDLPGSDTEDCIRATDNQPEEAPSVVHSDIVELDAAGTVVWTWSSEDHIDENETRHRFCFDLDPGPGVRWGLDLAHINAIDVFPDGDYLVTMRHTDSVYRIDHGPGAAVDGAIVWKLGGTPTSESLELSDPLGGPNAAHDGRVLPNGHITLHDNRPFAITNSRPRAVEYAVDEGAGTATLVWSHTSANTTAGTLGSVRRQPDGSTVIGWGAAWSPWMEELDASGNQVMSITVPAPSHTFYRVVKLPAATYDRDQLRALGGGSAEAP